MADPVTIGLAAASLLGGFFSKKKRNNEANRINAANDRANLLYRQQMAARQDAIDRGNTDVANQQSQANERTRLVRNKLAQALLSVLKSSTIDKDIAGGALEGASGSNPIRYTAPPNSVVAPNELRINPNTGNVIEGLGNIAGALAQAREDNNQLAQVEAERERIRKRLESAFAPTNISNAPINPNGDLGY